MKLAIELTDQQAARLREGASRLGVAPAQPALADRAREIAVRKAYAAWAQDQIICVHVVQLKRQCGGFTLQSLWVTAFRYE